MSTKGKVSQSALSGCNAVASSIDPWQRSKVWRREWFLLSFHFFQALSLNHLWNFFGKFPVSF